MSLRGYMDLLRADRFMGLAAGERAALPMLDNVASLSPRVVYGIRTAALQDIRSEIVEIMGAVYKRSGADVKSGTLWRTCVEDIFLRLCKQGVLIFMASSASYPNGGNVYASAMSKKFGAVRGLKGGKKTKKLLKMAGQVRVTGKLPDFFTLSSADKQRIWSLYMAAVNRRLAKYNIHIGGPV